MKLNVEKLRELKGHKGSIFAMDLDREHNLLYTSGDDGVVARWTLASPKEEGEGVLQIGKSVYALHVYPEAGLLCVGTSDGALYILDLESNKILYQDHAFQASIFDIRVIERDCWVLYGKGNFRVLGLQRFEEKYRGKLGKENLRKVIWGLEPKTCYLGSSDGHITLLHSKTFTPIQQWEAHANSVFTMAILPDSKILLSGGRDAHLNAWDLRSHHKEIRKIPAHNFTLNHIDIHPLGNYFATASRDKTVKIWDAYSLELLKVINRERNEGHTHSVNKVVWLDQSLSFASCSDDRRIIIWRLEESDS